MGVNVVDEATAVAELARSAARAVGAALVPEDTSVDDLFGQIEDRLGDRDLQELLVDAVLEGHAVPDSLLRPVVVLWSRDWDDSGRRSLLNLVDLPTVEDPADDLLVPATGALVELAVLATPHLSDDADRVPARLAEVGRLAAGAGRLRESADLFLHAAQLAGTSPDVDWYADEAGRQAAASGSADLVATVALLRVSLAEAGLDAGRPATRLAALDALDGALRHWDGLPDDDPARIGLLTRAAAAAGVTEDVAVLLATRLRLPVSDPVAAGTMAAARSVLEPRWNLSADDLAQRLQGVAAVAASVEMARALLDLSPDAASVHASWATWSFDHPAYRRAVPHGRSFTRERDLDELRLLLHHETIHVLSMVGGIGLSVLALRAAAMEVELDLLALTAPDDVPSWLDRGIATLDEPDLARLSVAERSVELLAKMRVVQDVWNPWFEGVAVFGELAEDPRPDDVTTPTSEILSQLVDLVPGDLELEGTELEDYERALLANLRRGEEAFAAAQQRLGPNRLVGYLTTFGTKYLAGYAAVRAVVASWRRSVGDLTGSQATRLLLHSLRAGTYDAVPDLGLPFPAFAAAAEDAMLAWVVRLADLPGEDVRRGSTTTERIRYQDGRIVDPAEGLPEADFGQLVAQALTSLRADRAPLDRIPGAEERLRDLLDAAAERLEAAGGEVYLADQLLDSWDRQMSVLPLGASTARFWLNGPTRHLVYALRVNDRRADDGRPSIDVGALPLDDEEFAAVSAAMDAHPFDRLSVARFGDLAPRGEGRGLGRNVMAFQLGDWVHVQPRGWTFGASEVSESLVLAVLSRVQPDVVLRMESRLLRESDGAAERTRRWTAPERDVDWGEIAPWILPWVHHVQDRAVLAGSGDGGVREREVSARLLELVTGDADVARRLVASGGSALAPAAGRESLFTVLLSSGFAPSPSPDGLPAPAPDGPLLRENEGRWDVRPMAGVTR